LRQVDGSQASRVSAVSNRPLKTGLFAGADFLIAMRRSCARRTFVVRCSRGRYELLPAAKFLVLPVH
jgi:hypothetical protein